MRLPSFSEGPSPSSSIDMPPDFSLPPAAADADADFAGSTPAGSRLLRGLPLARIEHLFRPQVSTLSPNDYLFLDVDGRFEGEVAAEGGGGAFPDPGGSSSTSSEAIDAQDASTGYITQSTYHPQGSEAPAAPERCQASQAQA